MITYKEAGVNIEAGDDFSKYIYEQIKSTWVRDGWDKVVTLFDDFSGLRCINISHLDNIVMGVGYDGIGTKVAIAEALGKYYTIAFDLLAMVCDDAVIRGAEPIFVGSIIDLEHIPLDCHIELKQLVSGYVEAAKYARVQILNGEVAELGNRIKGQGKLNLNWGAGVIWFADRDRLISGKNIEVNDSIVLLREKGFRSNGLSLVRKIYEKVYGPFNVAQDDILNKILTPSRIYTPAIVDMTGGVEGDRKVEISGMAHITGGGLPSKLGRMLKPSGLGAIIDDPFDPPEIMSKFQREGDVFSVEAYNTWNMGNGFAIVTKDPITVIDIAKEYDIEAKFGGKIIDKKLIQIMDRGAFSKGKLLSFKI